MIYVGEIFNFREYHHNRSDVPIVFNAVKNGLLHAFNKFEGFWSIVHVAEDKNVAYIYTDHLAKKPLYMLYEEDTLAICSEILPLVLISERLIWDHHNLSTTAKWGYSPRDDTPFFAIKKAPTNFRLCIDLDTFQIIDGQSYLAFPAAPTLDLREALERAVKLRLVSDIPISILLSGGLDSTIIYQLVRKYTNDITVFHINNDEVEYLDYLDFSGVAVRQVSLDRTSILLPLLSNQTPVDLGSMIQQYQLSKAIQDHDISVALSGDGADELFGGYRRAQIYDSQMSDIFDELIYYHLPRLDRQMMAHTVELRCPYLSPEVINFALSVPYAQRTSKQILKETFKDIVPGPILTRDKEPLKIKDIRTNPTNWRLDLIQIFVREMEALYERERY
ncbi:hypothetical protein GWN42_26040 [candidate division KSB1 bacterium]|nr:hypothetical protein [candidate division KSB1 bacterium]